MEVSDEKMERDPHYIPKVGIESQTGVVVSNWIKFMDTLEEMQYIAVRDEIQSYRRLLWCIKCLYG